MLLLLGEIDSVFLEMALDVFCGDAVDIHFLEDGFGGGIVDTNSVDDFDKEVMEFWRPNETSLVTVSARVVQGERGYFAIDQWRIRGRVAIIRYSSLFLFRAR